jgi:hypothetical protein
LTTIVLGKGEHQIDGKFCTLYIRSAMNIVGDPEVAKEEIVVLGGIDFAKGIQGNCHLQHLTLRPPRFGSGVEGLSSFTMDDVIVEQCEGSGVCAQGLGGVGVCTNLEVRQCGQCGVVAYSGASITLIGAKTTVHHNCTTWDGDTYGLCVNPVRVDRPPSTIQLVAPLTKEHVSTDNGGSGNFGYWGKEASAAHIKSLGHSIYQISQKRAIETIKRAKRAARHVRVPKDCSTLQEPVDRERKKAEKKAEKKAAEEWAEKRKVARAKGREKVTRDKAAKILYRDPFGCDDPRLS